MTEYFEYKREGHSIRAKLYCGDRGDIRTVILFGHGFGGHKDNLAAEKFAERVISKNERLALLTFNWPCHGDDTCRQLRLADCDSYLQLMITHILEEYGRTDPRTGEHVPPTLYAYANSFGAYLFLKYISEHGNPFQKIALRSPAVNMYDVLTRSVMSEEELARVLEGNTVQVGFDRKIDVDAVFLESLKQTDITLRSFAQYADSMLIHHGTLDEVVPVDAVEAFARANAITYIPVEGGDHRFLDPAKMNAFNERIISFFGLR